MRGVPHDKSLGERDKTFFLRSAMIELQRQRDPSQFPGVWWGGDGGEGGGWGLDS